MDTRRFSQGTVVLLCAAASLLSPRGATAQGERVVIPENTVVRVELAEEIGSRTARRGERVTARLDEDDRSGFPAGTRFEGAVTEVRRAAEDRPAILDMEFRRAVLPNGSSERIRGDLVSLGGEDVRTTAEGRLESRRRGGFDWKWVGIGAGGGAVLGELFGDDFLKGALLGGLGGAIYGYLNREEKFREVELKPGTEFGIRLDRTVAFETRPGDRSASREAASRERVLGSRGEFRLDTAAVSLDGRPVRFGEARPLRINGSVYVPLQPVAAVAGWDLRHRAGVDAFQLSTPAGEVRGFAGDTRVTRGDRSYTLEAPPLLVGGEIYVPLEYLSRFGGLRVDWNGRERLDLRTGAASRPGGRPLGLSELVQGLAALDYAEVKTNIRAYRVIDLETRLDGDRIATLRTLLRENPTARRNRNLLTDFMRDAELITNNQTVVGASSREKVLYIL